MASEILRWILRKKKTRGKLFLTRKFRKFAKKLHKNARERAKCGKIFAMKPKTAIAKNLAGGKGETVLNHILSANELNDKTRMFAEVTLAPGTSIGFHAHHGESETYYILAGTGAYNDNGEIRTISRGDVTFTASGNSHGIENTGTENLVFIALILKD